ncbi:hypothetical protein [Flavobacterium sp. WC2509]|uniref:hypothetical protein n=1 Tax=Flavobacterium sp. WC2509 TaxID=3461406 RepID=UPI0040440124
MRKDSEKKLLALGFDTELIDKINSKSLGITGLKGQSKSALIKNDFTEKEAELIISKTNRKNIDIETINLILEKSGEVCCFCKDGNNSRPFQIHHIEEYHINQNNDEQNLVLVCPNHHVNIHKTNIDTENQKLKKRSWENLWQIATKYNEKGISFPFAYINYIDYKRKGSISDIFKFGSPIPSVCVILCKNPVAYEASDLLKSENKLIIAGSSGSGKTTLAYGIAGINTSHKTYTYTVGSTTTTEDCFHILLFLSEAISKIILIIDDANTKLNSEQIENILNASDKDKLIIIVNTRNDFKGNGNIEQHFQKSVQYINWNKYQQFVKTSILLHENEVIAYLRENNLDEFNENPIGFTEFATPLNRVLESYSKTSDSVWQFIYLLGGGLKLVKSLKEELQNTGRFDIIFLYICIKQISEVEKGVSITDIFSLYNENEILKKGGPPENDWLKEQLEFLCAKRILKNERGRYKSIHRQYAIKYIEKFFLDSPEECYKLFDSIFNDYTKVKEIAILWSWFRNTKLNIYLKEWYKSKNTNWDKLIEAACKHDLETVGILAYQMHSKALGSNNNFVKNAFIYRADEIAKLINRFEDNTLYNFYNLSTTLRYHCSEIIKPILDLIDKGAFVSHLKQAKIYNFRSIDSLFYNISEFYPNWIIDLSNNFVFDDFKPILEEAKSGDIDSISETISFLRRYILDFKRSDFKYCVKLIRSSLLNCSLETLNYPIMPHNGLFEITLFNEDLKDILSALNISQFANDFTTLSPRHWKKLLSLSMLSVNTDSTVIRDIIENIDENSLCNNIEKYYFESMYEFRVLIHQLCYGSEEKKRVFALKLMPFIEKLYNQLDASASDQDILQAYNRLDKSLAEEIAIKYKRTLPDRIYEISERDEKLLKEIENLEKEGEDYDLWSNRLTIENNTCE